MSLWHAFQQLPTPVQTGVMIEVGILIFALCLLGWSLWNRAHEVGKNQWWLGYNTAKKLMKEEHSKKRVVDTQENIFGFMKNRLEPHDRRVGGRGVRIHPLYNYNSSDKNVFSINIFWYNGSRGTGILGIDIHPDSIHVSSFDGALCPQGEKRSYITLGVDTFNATGVVRDVEKFIEETNAMDDRVKRANAR